jgi:tetratricopeptide (TPR) repeat protein
VQPAVLRSNGRQRRDPHDRARELHTTAVAEGRFGHAARAIRTLRRGLSLLDRECVDRADCRALTAELLLSLAVNEAEVNGVERGRAVLAEAQQVLGDVDEPWLQVRLHNNHVLIATRAGDLRTASEQRDRALDLLAHATPHDRVYTLLNGGNIHLYRGELAPARQLLGRAAAEAATAGLRDPQFRALHNLGYVEFLGGNLPAALAAMDAANEIDVPISRGIWALDRSRILLEAGLVREADEALAAAWRIFAADRTAQDLGEVEVARAECALLLGDAAAARRFAGRARDRFRRRGNLSWMRYAELVLLQGDMAAGRPRSRLAPIAFRLEGQLVERAQPGRARTAALVGVDALLDAGRVAEAAQVVERLDRHAQGDPISARTHGRYVHARLARAQGDAAAARREIRAGMADLASYQAGFGSLDLRAASAVHGRRLAALDIELALEDGRAAAVLAAVERGRAVSSRLPPVRPPADARSAELMSELRQVTETLRAGAGGAADLLARRFALEKAVQQRAWSLPGQGSAGRAAGVAAIRAAVSAAGCSLASYFHAGGQLRAVVVEGAGLRTVDLGPWEPLEALLRRARADYDALAVDVVPPQLRAVAARSLRTSLAGLDERLLAPLRLDGPLVVLPTGLLGALPWPALPSARGRAVTVAPSATAWLRAAGRRPDGEGVIALAGPALQRAEAEARAVAGAWPSGSAGSRASRGDVEKALHGAAVVHIAAHGHHQIENPLFSSVRLADGPLFAYEIEHSPPHVVLSACELGTATVRPGDEALGLTSVLLHAGTACVVSSVARVGDRAAEATMAAYHARLAAGEGSASALAAALSDVVAAGVTEVPPPFVAFGSSWAAATGLETGSPLA